MGTEITKNQQLQESKTGTENSIEEIVRSASPTFLALQNGGAELDVKKLIASETYTFIKSSYPATDAELVSKEFAKELFLCKDWKLADIKMFLKFIKENATNPDFKVLGNSIGVMQLLKYVSYYEDKRSEIRESKAQAYKNQENQKYAPEVKEYIEKILKTIKDHSPKIQYTGKPQKLFDPIIYETDYDTFLKLIPELSPEEKEKFRTSIFCYESILPTEMARREHLIEKLK